MDTPDAKARRRAPETTERLVEDLARTVYIFARHRPGRVAAVSVRVTAAHMEIGPPLSARLEEYGMDGVMVHTQLSDAPPGLVSVEFER